MYQQAADMLFDVAKSWLMQHDMEAHGWAYTFGERDVAGPGGGDGFKSQILFNELQFITTLSFFENYMDLKYLYNQPKARHSFFAGQTQLSEVFFLSRMKITILTPSMALKTISEKISY